MPTYTDIYIRDNLGDSGVIPSQGNPFQSPDIIPYQNGTLTPATLVSTWPGPDQGQSVVAGAPNNVYVRGKNLGAAASSGTTTLYYAKASLILLPNQWIQATTASGQAQVTVVDQNLSPTIAANAVCFANPPYLVQGPPPASNDHYCMIAIANTPTNPITVPTSFPSNAAFAQWVQNNPAVGWRNLSVVASGSKNFTRTFVFANLDTDAQFYFRLIAQNFATGTPVTAQCTDQRCPINQTLTLPAPDPSGNQIAGFEGSVPGGFSGNLTFNATSAAAFSPTARMSFEYYKIPSMEDALERSVSAPVHIAQGMRGETALLVQAELIKLGACTVVVGT